MEIYEFSLEIPLPENPVEKGRLLVRCGVIAEIIAAGLARERIEGAELDHRLVRKRGDYGKRKLKNVPQVWVGRSSITGSWSWFIAPEEAAASGALDVTEATQEECEIVHKIMMADRAGAMPPASIGRRMKQLLARRVVPPEPVVTAPPEPGPVLFIPRPDDLPAVRTRGNTHD